MVASNEATNTDVSNVRNPDWTRDELVLALDLYFHLAPRIGNEHYSEVIELSQLLNQLPIHYSRPDATRFRNPRGVAMKLGNFQAIDPSSPGMGLSHGSIKDKEVWNDFSNDRQALHATAQAIRAFATAPEMAQSESTAGADTNEEYSAREGALLFRQHKFRERNRDVVRRKKEQALRRDGVLRCETCDFVFALVYGELGANYIECHHVTPLAELKPGQRTRLEDLALLCANCHRMIHQGGKTRTISELKGIIAIARG